MKTRRLSFSALHMIMVGFFLCTGCHQLRPNHAMPQKHYDKWIVVTTINYPSQALKKLSQLEDWQLVVVGDKKTPKDWHLENCIYLDPETQQELGFAVVKHLPWNHYSRKNIGYLYAIKHGARLIYETDDDTLPISGLTALPEHHACAQVTSSSGIVNLSCDL